MRCDYGEMEWYCCLPQGHAGDHRSHDIPPATSIENGLDQLSNRPPPGEPERGT